MISRVCFENLFDAASIQRWNDKLRPVELTEMDKQAHKMIIAYFIGKFEDENSEFNWIDVIEGGVFEYMQRCVLTDLKPQLLERIEKKPEEYKELNEWMVTQIEEKFSASTIGTNGEFLCRMKKFFFENEEKDSCRVLRAAHLYSSKWEFDIIERSNPSGYEIDEIKNGFMDSFENFYDLKGFQKLVLHRRYRNFIDVCGLLRFQIRWSHMNRIPRTSVLGHMLIVAMFAYFLSLEMGACKKRLINNYLTGLFHDLPEALTRDIINPVKKSVTGLDEIIKKYERDEMENKIFKPGLVPEEWKSELKRFTEDEFSNTIIEDGETKVFAEGIFEENNKDFLSPRDGELVKLSDDISAFIEAHLALKNNPSNEIFKEACERIKEKYENKSIAGIDASSVFAIWNCT